MAYNDYMDYGVGVETEEERRKREEQERLAAEQGGGFMDKVGSYVQGRVDRAIEPFTNPGAALDKRLGMTPEQSANTEVQSQTVKTYQDGSQEEITKRQIPAAPVAPEQAQAPAPQMAPQPQAAPAPQATPVPPTAQTPVAGAQQTTDPAEIQRRTEALRSMISQGGQAGQAPAAPTPVAPTQLPQPGPGVQVASTQPGAGVAEAAQAARAVVPTTPTGQPQVGAPSAAPSLAQAGAQAQAAMVSPEERQQQAIIAAHNETDPAKRRQMFAQVLGAADTTEGNRALANKFIAEDYIKQRSVREAEQKIAEATPTELARYMKEQKKEGSYVKAILLARLGLTDLAKREQELINPELKMDTATVGADKFTIVRNPQGGIEQAFDINGNKASQEQIAKISAAALPTKAHLLPSVHGTPVVKEVNGQQVGGLRMYDPQTQSSYVQVGDQRMPDTGWITPGQAPGAVYTAAGAKAQGTAAGEGFTPTPLPARPGAAAPAGPADQAMITRLQGDVAALDREIAATKPNSPGAQQRLAILNQERAATQQRLQQAGGAIQGLTPGGGTVGAPVGGTVAEQKKNLSVAEARAKEEIQVAGKRSEGFNKHIDETITPDAINGDKIAGTRKEQFSLFDRPGVDAGKIFGIANGAGAAPGDQRWTMFRDILLGKVSEPADRIRERAAALGLNPQEQSAVAEYAIKNADINALTLKGTAGPGSVSEAEQRLNQERNVDPTKVPMLGGYNAMAQSQFNGDLARYKGDWSTTSKATNTAQLEKDWRKEKAKITELYTDMARQRIDYIASMGNTAAAIKEGYRRFPVPQYDPATETWIKKKPLGSYER